MSLEDKVNDKQSDGFVKKTLKFGYAGTMVGLTSALSLATYGTTGLFIGAGIAAGSFIGGTLKKSKSFYTNVVDSLKSYSAFNLIAAPVLHGWDYVIPKIVEGSGIIAGAARGLFASTVFNAFFETMYKGSKHLIDNYLNPVGIVKSIKNNFYNEWKRSAIGFSPGYTLAASGITPLLGIPTFAYNAFGLNLYGALKPVPMKKNGHPHASSYANALSPKGAH